MTGKEIFQAKINCFEKFAPSVPRSGPKVIKLFLCLTQLSMKFILLINVKMPTIVGILTFISRMNIPSECFEQDKLVIFQYFTFYEQSKSRVQLS